MSYQHLTINERTKIETLFHLGWTARAIARHIQRHHSTVSRELNRVNRHSIAYLAVEAQADYQHKRIQSKPKGKWMKIRVHYLTQKLAATWSPEQFQGRMKDEQPDLCVAFKTIYRWIYQGKLVNGNTAFLRHKGKRRKPRENRGRLISVYLFISDLKRLSNVKPSDTGNSTPLFQVEEKVKVA